MLGLITKAISFIGIEPYKLALGAMAILMLTGLYFSWKSSVKREALYEFNTKQMEQVLEDRADLKRKLDEIVDDQRKIIAGQTEFKDNIDRKITNLQVFLKSDAAKKLDRPSSEILKRTIQDLKESR
jgi:hypothetical protein